jgi:hypothetical protein
MQMHKWYCLEEGCQLQNVIVEYPYEWLGERPKCKYCGEAPALVSETTYLGLVTNFTPRFHPHKKG